MAARRRQAFSETNSRRMQVWRLCVDDRLHHQNVPSPQGIEDKIRTDRGYKDYGHTFILKAP